jgi:hypothetical protein
MLCALNGGDIGFRNVPRNLNRFNEALDSPESLKTNRAKGRWALGNRGVSESIVRCWGPTGRANERGSRGQRGRIWSVPERTLRVIAL